MTVLHRPNLCFAACLLPPPTPITGDNHLTELKQKTRLWSFMYGLPSVPSPLYMSDKTLWTLLLNTVDGEVT